MSRQYRRAPAGSEWRSGRRTARLPQPERSGLLAVRHLPFEGSWIERRQDVSPMKRSDANFFKLVAIPFALAVTAFAADEPAPTPPPPADTEWVTGSVDFGYRWRTDVAGSFDTYRS